MKTIEIGKKPLAFVDETHILDMVLYMGLCPCDGCVISIEFVEHKTSLNVITIVFTSTQTNSGEFCNYIFTADFNIFSFKMYTKYYGRGIDSSINGNISIKGLNHLIETGYSLPISTSNTNKNKFLSTKMKTIEMGGKTLLEITEEHLFGLCASMGFLPGYGWESKIGAFDNTLVSGNAWMRVTSTHANSGNVRIYNFSADFNLFTFELHTKNDARRIESSINGNISITGLNYLIENGYSLPISTFKCV